MTKNEWRDIGKSRRQALSAAERDWQSQALVRKICADPRMIRAETVLLFLSFASEWNTDALIRAAFREEIPGTTKFIIAQRVASVEDSDLIIIMNEGKIAATGTHEGLLATNRIYQETYYSQNKAGASSDKLKEVLAEEDAEAAEATSSAIGKLSADKGGEKA